MALRFLNDDFTDSRTDLQRRVFGVVDVSPHVFGIRDFRKHL